MAVEALHVVPGRARLRVTGLYQNALLKQRLERRLREAPEVITASANIWSSNIVVRLRPRASLADLMQRIRRILLGDDEVRPEATISWYRLSVQRVLRKLRTSLRGLSRRIAHRKLRFYRENTTPALMQRSRWQIIAEQFTSLPVALLGAAAGVALLTGAIADAGAIIGVVLINAAIGYVTESQSERTISSLTKTENETVKVQRDGIACDIPAALIVPGDVLVLGAGVLIAADARVVRSDGLTVNEAPLTGESAFVEKSVNALATVVPLADRHNMVYRGTTVTGGSGYAIVVATGRKTEIAAIQRSIGEAEPPETPMQQQLGKLGRQLVLLSCGACLGVFCLGLLRGQGFLLMLKTAMSLAVAAVPEGLPTLATTTLAFGIERMRRQNVYIRQLDAIETIAATQVIAFDKTGTLTENKMSVVAVAKPFEIIAPQHLHSARDFLTAITLCNDTAINGGDLNGSSSTEAALMRLALDGGLDIAAERRLRPRVREVYRTETRQYMATFHHDDTVFIKGNPSQVLGLCSTINLDGAIVPLTDDLRARVLATNDGMTERSLRVLAVAKSIGNEEDATFLGLLGMADPLRPGMTQLIGALHRAGIHTIMITGDQRGTAEAVGRELGLANGGQPFVIEVNHLSDRELAGLAPRTHVFARVTPEHKLRIVRALQQAGQVVAMIGDGVNDSPALRAADVGVALGSGTDAARAVADIILADDEIPTLLVAIEQGRTLYTNIEKAISYLLATNLSEIIVVLASIGFGVAQPLTPVQLLWINLLSDIFPALGLGFEPAEANIMARPPRDPARPIVDTSDLLRLGKEGSVIAVMTMLGHTLARGRGSVAFGGLVFAQLLHALSARTRHRDFWQRQQPVNRPLLASITGSMALQVLATMVPWLRNFLGITRPPLRDVAIILGIGVASYSANEMLKPRV